MIPGFDIQIAYRSLARRFETLAREAGSGAGKVGNMLSRRPTSAAPLPQKEIDAELRAYKQLLSKTFLFADQIGQVDAALSLLKANIPAEHIQAILETGKAEAALGLSGHGIRGAKLMHALASVPEGSGTRNTGLAKRMADDRAVRPQASQAPAATPSDKARAEAAFMIAAYNRAFGRTG